MRRILTVLSLLLLAIGGYFLYQNHLQDKQSNRAMFDMVMNEKMDLLYVQAKNWKKPINLKIEDQRLEGDYKVLSEFILRYWVDNIEARNDYLRQLDRAEWGQFLNIERLDKDRAQGYTQTKAVLRAVRQITTEFKTKNQQISTQALMDVETLKIHKALAKSMTEKLQLTQNSSNEIALLHIELEILDRAEEMFELLKTRKWLRQGNMILFEKDVDVRKFNLLYAEVNEFQQQIEDLKKQNASVLESENTAFALEQPINADQDVVISEPKTD